VYYKLSLENRLGFAKGEGVLGRMEWDAGVASLDVEQGF